MSDGFSGDRNDQESLNRFHHDKLTGNLKSGMGIDKYGGGPKGELTDVGSGTFLTLVFWTFLLPIKIGGWISKIFLFFTGIIGRIWQTILFSAAVSFVLSLLIMLRSGVDENEYVEIFTGLVTFDFNPEYRLWQFVVLGIAAVFGAVYFLWHYRAVRCAGSFFFFIIQIAFCIMVYGAMITGIILGLIFEEPSEFWIGAIPLILAAGFYVVCMIAPMKEAAALKKAGEPLPGEMTIGESIDGIIFNGYTIRKLKTVLITSIIVTPAAYAFVYFLHRDILIPLGAASGNFGSASLAILIGYILLSFPVAFFCHWYYVENGDAESFDEETGAYEGEKKSVKEVIVFILIFSVLFAALYAFSFNQAFFNNVLGINRLSDTGPIQIEAGKGFIQQAYEKIMGGIHTVRLGTPEIILLSSVCAVPVLFLLSTRFRWKVVFLSLFAIAILGITFFVRTIIDEPAFPSFVYNLLNLPAVRQSVF